MRGILLVVLLIIAVLALGFGIVELVSLPFGGLGWQMGIFWGFVLALVALGVLIFVGRRRQRAAQAKRAEQTAARQR
jgi:membrane protein implicated in regulation of membrane protease activity